MKTRLNIFAMLLVAMLLALPAVAHAQFDCVTNNNTIVITHYTGPGGAVVIPDTINGLPVTSIGTNAFQNCMSLTSITIPNRVTGIGDGAFQNCTSLTSVTIPNGVTNMADGAFYQCTSLTRITIGNAVIRIGNGAFNGCTSLTNATIGTSVTSIGNSAFCNCRKLTNVTIPGSVTHLWGSAFQGCNHLTGIYFQGNAPGLGSSVFTGDYNATVYYLPGTSGWSMPFGGLPSVMLNPPNPAGSLQVTLSPTTITNGMRWQVDGGVAQTSGAIVSGLSVGNHTVSFSDTNGWAIPASQTVAVSADSTATASGSYCQLTYSTNNGAITITGRTGASPSGAVVLPGTINGLPVISIEGAFQNCSSLTSVTVPGSVTYVWGGAFSGCSSLTEIYFQANAPSFSGGFSGHLDLTFYYLPGTSGWGSTFGGRPAVMLNPPIPAGSLQVTLSPTAAITNGMRWQVDGGVEQASGAIVSGLSVGNHTVSFSPLNGWAMPASQSVAVRTNATNTASGNYWQLTHATNNGAISITGFKAPSPGGAMILPGTINGLPVTDIGGFAFRSCYSLTGVTIPDSVANIYYGAFVNCSSLTSVTIPYGVTNVGDTAFANCSSLTSITVDPANSFYSSTNEVLFNKNQTTLVQFPGGVGGSYTIPDGVTGIGNNAFQGCAGLTSVTIPNSVTSIHYASFRSCSGLTNVMIGTNVTSISADAFEGCTSLTTVTIPSSVTYIPDEAFISCFNLTGIYFQGNAPTLLCNLFDGDDKATVYHLPWTSGWPAPGEGFGGAPTALWLPQAQTGDASFGVLSNQFGFNITWASDLVVVVEACTDPANPVWTPVGTNTLTGGSSYFSDPQWTNHPDRFYRLRSQ